MRARRQHYTKMGAYEEATGVVLKAHHKVENDIEKGEGDEHEGYVGQRAGHGIRGRAVETQALVAGEDGPAHE